MSTCVTMRDGRYFEGPIWEWRPKEGWFTICDYDDGRTQPTRIELAAVMSAMTKGARVSATSGPDGEDRDELERARREGWTG